MKPLDQLHLARVVDRVAADAEHEAEPLLGAERRLGCPRRDGGNQVAQGEWGDKDRERAVCQPRNGANLSYRPRRG